MESSVLTLRVSAKTKSQLEKLAADSSAQFDSAPSHQDAQKPPSSGFQCIAR